MTTHQDWLNAKQQRDNAAYRAMRYLLADEVAAAKAAAAEWKAAEDEMDRVEAELDGAS